MSRPTRGRPRRVTAEARHPRRAAAAFAAGFGVLGLATAGLFAGTEPFSAWYYHFAWLGTLLIGDALVSWTGGAGRPGRFLLLDDAARTASLLFWSAVLWLFFEAINLRIRNWYYVMLPRETALRWTGEALAFATVLPAVLVAEAALNGFGLARGRRWRALRVDERRLRALPLLGAVMFILPMIWPRYFFPLVWVALAPILEPFVYRRAPERSLLADLERGRPGRLLRLLAGGAAIGLLWELFNIGARTKWIYTVPGFAEAPRLFEMPVLGFFGFPPFAVGCFVAWQALIVARVAAGHGLENVPESTRSGARDRDPTHPPAVGHAGAHRAYRIAAHAAAAYAAIVVLAAMDRRTVDSLRPRLELLHNIGLTAAAHLRDAGYDVFRLAAARPPDVAIRIRGVVVSDSAAAAWIRAARLATFRGIGAEHAAALARAGIATPSQLARSDPDSIARALTGPLDHRTRATRARVWIHAARRQEMRSDR